MIISEYSNLDIVMLLFLIF